MSHRANSRPTGTARPVVLGAALAAVFLPHAEVQLAKPLSTFAAPAPLATINCLGLPGVPMTADAEQALPLRLVANLPCGLEVSVLSDFEGYTVAVRTPEGPTGYVARVYLTALSRPPSPPVAPSAAVKGGVASWQAGAPGCDQFSSENGIVESMTVEGVTVRVSLQNTGWKFRANVAVANNGEDSVALDPSHFLLDEVRPILRPLAYQNPDHISAALSHQAYTTVQTAGPSLERAVLRQPAEGGDGRNYFAPAREQSSSTGNPYGETAEESNADALRKSSVAPGNSLRGAVWFERAKHAKQLLLRIPVNGVFFEFPLSFEQAK